MTDAAAVGATWRAVRRADRVGSRLAGGAGAFNVALVALVAAFLAVNALPLLQGGHAVEFFTSTQWDPDSGIGFGGESHFGAWLPIIGSFSVVALALVLAVPFALAVAVFVTETNPRAGQRWIRPALEVLVGVPSVVYGYLGLIALLPLLAPLAPAGNDGSGILAAGIVLAVMVMPTVATLSADGLMRVPTNLREASLALGATRWQTIRRVQLPAARAGIITGVVLGFARAMGEALAVSLVIGDVNALPSVSKHGVRAVLQPFTTMTVSITDGVDKLAINPDGTAARYALALVLMVTTFICIAIVRFVSNRSQV